MTEPISPEPVREWQSHFTPAYVSNGTIGLRVGPMPLRDCVATVNGFVEVDPETGVERAARMPYPLAGNLRINRTSLAECPGRAVLREQRYDFFRAELHTIFDFHGDGARAEVSILTLCSRPRPAVALQEIEVRVDADCELELTVGVQRHGLGGEWREPTMCPPDHGGPVDCLMHWGSVGQMGSLGIAYGTLFGGTDQVFRRFDEKKDGSVFTTYAFRAEPGRTYWLAQCVSMVSDVEHTRPQHEAARLLTAAVHHGHDRLRGDNQAMWADRWRGRLQLIGAPERWQRMADAAYFYLHTSVHRSAPSSTHVFGLSFGPDYHYYRGHILWDIETFCLPPLLLTDPDSARALLLYRRTRLPGASANADIRGYSGAQYPWESSPRHGHESSPVQEQQSYTEEHVSMDVALAFAQYVHATGDRTFAADDAWPVMSEVMRWVDTRVQRTARGFEIPGVSGIAETRTTVNNSAFMNASVVRALRETAALGHLLGKPVPESWEKIADALVLPIDPQTKVICNHDDYDPNEPQGETPEGAAVLFPLQFDVDPEIERRTLEFYLRFADRYVGAPMLSAMLGVYAARLGDRERAAELFEKGYAEFVVPPFEMPTEFSPAAFPDKPHPTPFAANMGSFLTSCLYGLTRLTLTGGHPADWCRRPITLPEGWEGIHVERIWTRGREASLTASHGADRTQIAEW